MNILDLRGSEGWLSVYARAPEGPPLEPGDDVRYLRYAAGGFGFQGAGSGFVEGSVLRDFCSRLVVLSDNPHETARLIGTEERGLWLEVGPAHSPKVASVRGRIVVTNVVLPAEDSPRNQWSLEFGFFCERSLLADVREVAWVSHYAG